MSYLQSTGGQYTNGNYEYIDAGATYPYAEEAGKNRMNARVVRPAWYSCDLFQCSFCVLVLVIGVLSVELVLRAACSASMLTSLGISSGTSSSSTVSSAGTGALVSSVAQAQQIATPEYLQMVFGASTENTKCTPDTASIVCPRTHVLSTGEAFQVYSEGTNVCVKRTDHIAGWTDDLVIECQTQASYRASQVTPTYATDATAATAIPPMPQAGGWVTTGFTGGYTMVTIGNTLADGKSTKCVAAEPNVHCDNSAEQVGRTGKEPDRFNIYYNDNHQICAHRTDANAPWGLNLVLKCKNIVPAAEAAYQHVIIGNSLQEKSDHKCVADPGNVDCSDHAEVGRTGKYQDTFEITQSNHQICAKRTDAAAAWGLNLIIKCKIKSE